MLHRRCACLRLVCSLLGVGWGRGLLRVGWGLGFRRLPGLFSLLASLLLVVLLLLGLLLPHLHIRKTVELLSTSTPNEPFIQAFSLWSFFSWAFSCPICTSQIKSVFADFRQKAACWRAFSLTSCPVCMPHLNLDAQRQQQHASGRTPSVCQSRHKKIEVPSLDMAVRLAHLQVTVQRYCQPPSTPISLQAQPCWLWVWLQP